MWYFGAMTPLEFEIELHRILAERPDDAEVLELAIKLAAENISLKAIASYARDGEKRAYKERDEARALRDAVTEVGTWNAAIEEAALIADKRTPVIANRIRRLLRQSSYSSTYV
jgi:hypothetical protein